MTQGPAQIILSSFGAENQAVPLNYDFKSNAYAQGCREMEHDLSPGASLPQLQRYVAQMEEARGFSEQDAVQKCLLLGEEIGELFKAVRMRSGLPVGAEAAELSLAHELADILIYICAIANRYDIQLDDALRSKEALNRNRTWAR